jgi:hypothetical protein
MRDDLFSRERLQICTIGLNLNLDDFKKESSENGVVDNKSSLNDNILG